jgi:hypothetical protein
MDPAGLKRFAPDGAKAFSVDACGYKHLAPLEPGQIAKLHVKLSHHLCQTDS